VKKRGRGGKEQRIKTAGEEKTGGYKAEIE